MPICPIAAKPSASSGCAPGFKTGTTGSEVAYGLTSLPPGEADSQPLMALVRGHWEIENRLHHVRDVSWDEDRCRAHVGHLPRNLAAMTNAAISIVRCQGRFRYLPRLIATMPINPTARCARSSTP